MKVPPLRGPGLGPVGRAYRMFERRFQRGFTEFMVLGGYRHGLFPDGDYARFA